MGKNTVNVYTKVDEYHKVRYCTTFEVWSVEEINDFIREYNTSVDFAHLDCEQSKDDIYNYDFFNIPYEEDGESKVKHVAVPNFDEDEAIEWRAREDARLFFAEWKLDVDVIAEAIIKYIDDKQDYFYSKEWVEYTESLSDEILDNYYTCYGRECKEYNRDYAIEEIENNIEHWAKNIYSAVQREKDDYYSFEDYGRE